MLKALGAGGVPVLLATGGADDAIVREAVAAAGGDVALVLGPAEAPAPVEELRLSAIAAARERFRRSVGVLDATDGGSAFALVALALAASHGAEFVLKRLVLDRGERGRDGASAVSPEELHRCVELLRQAEGAFGDGAVPEGASAPRADDRRGYTHRPRRRPHRRASALQAHARAGRSRHAAVRGAAGHRPARRAPDPGRRGDPGGHARMTAPRP